MNKSKVVFIMNNFAVGGVERFLLDLMSQLKNSYELRAVAVLGGGPLESTFRQASLDIHHAYFNNLDNRKLPFKLFWIIFAPITLVKILFFLLKVKPNAVITSLYQADIIGIFAAWLARVPKRVVIQHDIQELSFGKKILKKIFALNLATAVVANSEATQDFLAHSWKVNLDKIRVIKNGIKLAHFQKALKEFENLKPILGIIGRLEPVKGHQCFLEALRILKETENLAPDVLIVGEGSLRLPLEHFCKDSNLTNVKFLGEVSDVGDSLRNIDILVAPSVEEGFGLVVLEGLTAGKIIVASDIPAFRELLHEGEYGILFPKGDVKKLAEILQTFTKDTLFQKKYLENIRKWTQTRANLYDIRTTAEYYQAIL